MDFLNPADAHFWIAIALVVFLVVLWRAKVPGLAAKALDEAALKVRAQLDEAARLRAEAQQLLDEVSRRHATAERSAKELMAAAEADAERLRKEAARQLEDDLRRRREAAERRIATAEAQAAAQVRLSAVELSAQMAQQILAGRIGREPDTAVDAAIAELPRRFS
jgi:F-type H+-transporting ATPase subunit b